jgi:hypothetical protein
MLYLSDFIPGVDSFLRDRSHRWIDVNLPLDFGQ